MKVNQIDIDPSEWPTPQLAAVRELLRQRACELGHLAEGAADKQAEQAIERTLAEDVDVPEPTDEECRRWFEAHKDQFRAGELVCARHILFQVVDGAPIEGIRSLAEATLQEIRTNPEVFEERARKNSNCPSGEHGGNLGQLQRGETVAEFDKALFEDETIGVLPKLVTTRYGFHIVSIEERIEGKQVPFDVAREQVAAQLRKQSESRALSQYVRLLAADAELEGVELDAASSPLVQ